jgi:hypothetical protein
LTSHHGNGCFRHREGVIAQEAHGHVVLLRPEDGSYYTLDGVGMTVWGLCDGTMNVEEIVESVCAAYDAHAEIVRADVREFLDDLLAERLLDRAP